MNPTHIGQASEKNPRVDKDFYPTPPKVTQALINTGFLSKEIPVWEPACGTGAMSGVLKLNGFEVLATDISTGQDFLTTNPPIHQTRQIVTNPPFNVSEQFIHRALDFDTDVFAFLLKSQYWHAAKRYNLFNEHPPAYVLPLAWRPNLNANPTGSGLIDFIWTVWIKGNTDTRYIVLKKPV